VADLTGSTLAFILLAGLVGSFVAAMAAVANYLLNRPKSVDDYGVAMMRQIKRLQSEAKLDRLRDRMEYVYAPLYSAVVSMREGKDVLPKGYTAGTPFNAWSKYPEIMQRIIDIFSNYPNLVENERVWKGWTQKESELREGEFWLGREVYEWFDAIEDEYHRIDSELHITEKAVPVEREYGNATLKFRIWSTTDWIEVGLVDSRHVTIKNRSLSKGTVKSVEEPNSSHIRIDHPDSAFVVTATFNVYSGPLFVFTRKGDIGTLKVDILNKNDELLFQIPEYGTTDQKFNHKEFGFEFNDWD
jgi:hypothetical protein